jgi:EAL domain-containing protein (putative c-di-GMP-specific phosphodiesterase class I)/GGDEF domain-containing protein
MLSSEHEERGRKFKLAIRAGLPVLALIGLVVYGTFFQNGNIHIGLHEVVMGAALVFVTTYFIFFLLEEDSQNSLLDPITRGYNYQAFLQHYDRKRPRTLGLLLVDNLGTINENYGTEEVDSMLRSLVYQLDAALRAVDLKEVIIGRKQGAEFLIAVEGTHDRLDRVLATFVRDHASIQEIEIDYRFAVLATTDVSCQKNIWHLHDSIMAQSKLNTDDETSETSAPSKPKTNALEQRIVEAVHAGKILFTFRPLYHVKTGQITTYEVAVKLPLPGEDPLLPRLFLPVINRLGLGREYDLLILHHALELLTLTDRSIAFSFNLSPFSLRNREFQAKAFEQIDASGIDPSRLIVELYERKTHHNLEGYLKTLSAFRAKGVRICIDNFGSSNASMEYMRHFKFDMVQFDRDFVGKLNDQAARAMLNSLIHMSRDLGIETIAKWVDNGTQKRTLENMGIDYLQGFLIAKPLSEDQLIRTYNHPKEE